MPRQSSAGLGSHDAVSLGVDGLQSHPVAGLLEIGADLPTLHRKHPIEEQRIDPSVIVEQLNVPQIGHGSGDRDMKVGCAVGGYLDIPRGGEGRRLKPRGVPAAAGDVDLEAVHRVGGEHAFEIGLVIAILPRRDVRL